MYVYNNVYADTREHMHREIAASIKSMFSIQGQPHPYRRLELSVAKLNSAPASYSCVELGFLVDTRRIMVSLPPCKWVEALTQLKTFCTPKRSVSLKEVARLVGNLTYICTI